MRKTSLPVVALFLTLAAVLFASCAPGCPLRGSGNVVEEQRDVSGFDRVSLKGIGNLKIEIGDEEGLRIEAEDNLLPHIKSEVSDGTLTIAFKWGVRPNPTKPIDFYLVAKELEEITISGAGTVEADSLSAEDFSLIIAGAGEMNIGDMEAESLEIDIAGAGDITIETLLAESLDASIAGSGKISIKDGKTEEQDISISGSGKYKAKSVENARAEVDIAGSGSVVLSATDSLETDIAGSGSVEYVGRPEVELNVVGSGTVKRIER